VFKWDYQQNNSEQYAPIQLNGLELFYV